VRNFLAGGAAAGASSEAAPVAGPALSSSVAVVAAQPLRFNSGDNNSARDVVGDDVTWIISDCRGGKLDAEGGMGARMADLRKVEALIRSMALPCFITLSFDREAFTGPEEAYDAGMKKLSELLSKQLGFKLWFRVIEVQTKTGDGWIHWHCVVDCGDTEFDDRAVSRLRPINLSRLQAEVKEWWCDVWKLGGRGGQDIQLAKKRGAIAGYLSKYIVKPWPAIPEWILQRKFLRLVGFSKAANQHLRMVGLTGRCDSVAKDRDKKSSVRKPVASLGERLASSALSCKVVNKTVGFVGTIPCRVHDLLRDAVSRSAVQIVSVSYQSWGGATVSKVRFAMSKASPAALERLVGHVVKMGYVEEMKSVYSERLDNLANGWWRMQSMQC
jgi:hypothetical protein